MIKILLVEDDKIIVANLTEYLNSEGYLVRSVFGQTAAMKLLAEEKVDLVLLDVSLAEGNGFSACRAIKSESELLWCFSAIIIITKGLMIPMNQKEINELRRRWKAG